MEILKIKIGKKYEGLGYYRFFIIVYQLLIRVNVFRKFFPFWRPDDDLLTGRSM